MELNIECGYCLSLQIPVKKEDLDLDSSTIEMKEQQTKPDCRDVAVQIRPDYQEMAVQTHALKSLGRPLEICASECHYTVTPAI